MTWQYLLFLSTGAACCTALFGLQLKKSGLSLLCAPLALLFGAVLGTVLSKLLYFLLLLPEQLDNYGIGGLLRTRPAEFSFVGGCIGACLGAVLAAKCSHVSVIRVLDVFAPLGAIVAAFARAGEKWLGLVGLGAIVENESMQFFPLALENEMLWGWFYAVFMLEAFCALICGLMLLFLSKKKDFAPGSIFLFTAFYLALPQIFCESLRSQCMKWGFIKIEQLLCALIVFSVILYACLKYRKSASFLRAFAPALLSLPCFGLLIGVEFALDKPFFGEYQPSWLCYFVMILLLAILAGIQMLAFRRLKKRQA